MNGKMFQNCPKLYFHFSKQVNVILKLFVGIVRGHNKHCVKWDSSRFRDAVAIVTNPDSSPLIKCNIGLENLNRKLVIAFEGKHVYCDHGFIELSLWGQWPFSHAASKKQK